MTPKLLDAIVVTAVASALAAPAVYFYLTYRRETRT